MDNDQKIANIKAIGAKANTTTPRTHLRIVFI